MKRNKKSLALTSNTLFWGNYKNKILIGEWCLDFNSEHQKSTNQIVMPSPYKSNEGEKWHFFIIQRYEILIKKMAPILNQANSQNLSIDAWRVILGPWLLYYLSAVNDRLLHINMAIELYGEDLEITTLDKRSYVACKDSFESILALKDDNYNLQLFSLILSFKGIPTTKKKLKINIYRTDERLGKLTKIRNFVARITKLISKYGYGKGVFLRSTYLPTFLILKANIRSIWQLFFSVSVEIPDLCIKPDYLQRRKILKLVKSEDEFEDILKYLMVYDLPLCFFETFNYSLSQSNKFYPNNVSIIFSANSWYFDEQFKLWAALSKDKGSKLIGNQHGGGYGSFLTFAEYHELSILDKFYSWGWAINNPIIAKLPASKLIKKKSFKTKSNNLKILWVGTSINRYLIEYPFLASFHKEYIRLQYTFFNALNDNVKKLIIHRPHHESYSRDIVRQLLDQTNNIKLENWDIKFYDSLSESSLFVCDHNSTTFLEALSLNFPTIIFWNPTHYKLFEHAKPYYQLLEDVEILHLCPFSAARTINNIISDVDTWWSNKDRQKAVRKFCNYLAYTDKSSSKYWENTLRSLNNYED
jgi:putative transferase (TIGR04331 family)